MIQNGGGLADKRLREQPHAEHAEHDADGAADDGEHHDFGEMLPHDAEASGAERHAHGDFALPQRRARGKQVGHVDARDQQHANAGAEHRVEQSVNLRAEHEHGVGHHVGADALVGRLEFAFELRGDRRDLRFRLLATVTPGLSRAIT